MLSLDTRITLLDGRIVEAIRALRTCTLEQIAERVGTSSRAVKYRIYGRPADPNGRRHTFVGLLRLGIVIHPKGRRHPMVYELGTAAIGPATALVPNSQEDLAALVPNCTQDVDALVPNPSLSSSVPQNDPESSMGGKKIPSNWEPQRRPLRTKGERPTFAEDRLYRLAKNILKESGSAILGRQRFVDGMREWGRENGERLPTFEEVERFALMAVRDTRTKAKAKPRDAASFLIVILGNGQPPDETAGELRAEIVDARRVATRTGDFFPM